MPFSPKTHKKPNPLWKRQDRAKYDEKRGSASERGYDYSWQKVREYHLQANPLCSDCLKRFIFFPGQEVHHIQKLADRPDLRDEPTNLMTLCRACHSVRTARGE